MRNRLRIKTRLAPHRTPQKQNQKKIEINYPRKQNQQNIEIECREMPRKSKNFDEMRKMMYIKRKGERPDIGLSPRFAK